MEISNVLRHVYSIVLICSCLTVAAEILIAPKKTFLQDKKAKLRCYINVEGSDTSHKEKFSWNGNQLKEEGEEPHLTNDKNYVFYELEVNKTGNYSCQEVNKTLGVVYEPPDTPFLPVLEVNTNVSISCPEGPPGSQNRLQIFGKDRDGQMENNTLSISNVGFKDGFIEGQCHYSFPPDTTDNKFPPDNITVSTEVQPIVMKMDVEKPGSEFFINASCTAYSNVTDLKVRLTASGKDPVYSVLNSLTVSHEFQKNSSNITCSLWYKNKKIWSKVKRLEETQPKVKEPKGYPTWPWILLGVFVGVFVGGMLVCIVFIICKKCRIKTAGIKISQPEPAKESSAEELEKLGKTSDHNSINGEEDNKNDESKIPLNDESQETTSV